MCLAAVMFTGGKDSAFALHTALLHGFDVKYLIVIRSKEKYSWMFHTPFTNFANFFEELTGIKTKVFETTGKKEEELKVLEEVKKFLEKEKIKHVFVGAIRSDYQRIRFNKVFSNFTVHAPLWHKNQERYMREISKIFKTMIISVSADGLQSLIGEIIDESNVEEIISLAKKFGFNPAFEGGEAETLVLDAPFYKKKLSLDFEIKKLSDYNYEIEVRGVKIEDKP